MNQRLLIQLSTPAVLIGLVLFGACLASVWYINRLQRNLGDIMSQDLTSLQAAQELEISLRQLRFHTVIYMLDPNADRQKLIDEDHARFEKALNLADKSVNQPREHALIVKLRQGYDRYLKELEDAEPVNLDDWDELVAWVDAHPVRQLVDTCEELLRLNKEAMERTADESKTVSQQARITMLLLGVLGPISGLIGGFGIARGLSRSIARLHVRLQAVHEQLDQDVASVRLAADSDLHDLDRQLDRVVTRVQKVVEKMQRQQAEILRGEQLAAVGQLAASVAHEIRNPLTAIKLLVGAALRPSGPSLSSEDLAVMHGEIARLEQTVQTLLDFARPPQMDRRQCDVRGIVAAAADLVRARAAQQQVELSVEQPPGEVPARVDRGQLSTVLVNLFLNALDALPRGGRITVRLEAPGADGVRLTVQDTGPGIPEAIRHRLFTPFATTKPTGTGLGLSISQRILRQHGGDLTAVNRPEGGACFTLRLPRETAGCSRLRC